MARQLKTRVYAKVTCEEIETDLGGGSATSRLVHEIEYDKTFTTGTTDGSEMDRVYSTDTALTTSPTDIDLSGSLASVLNGSNTVVMADLCLICSVNDQTSSGDVRIGAAATNPLIGPFVTVATDSLAVKPTGLFLWCAPNGTAVTGGSADVIRAVASTGTVSHRTILAGRSA
jgi:hypothetical protein